MQQIEDMVNLIIAIVIYLIALLLASISFFTDKGGKKSGKLIILIVVIIAALGGGWLEYTKYRENKETNDRFSKLIISDSIRGVRFDSLQGNYNNLAKSFTNLSNSYSDIKMALTNSKLFYDSINGKIISINKISQQSKNGQNEYFDNKAPNLGIQGGSNNTQNFYGPIQPHPDETVIRNIENDYPDKKALITIVYLSSSIISQNYVNELIGLLKKAGHSNILIQPTMMVIPDKGVYPFKMGGKWVIFVQAE
jgi:hypothetical protein